jgi:hypothetical protein
MLVVIVVDALRANAAQAGILLATTDTAVGPDVDDRARRVATRDERVADHLERAHRTSET